MSICFIYPKKNNYKQSFLFFVDNLLNTFVVFDIIIMYLCITIILKSYTQVVDKIVHNLFRMYVYFTHTSLFLAILGILYTVEIVTINLLDYVNNSYRNF